MTLSDRVRRKDQVLATPPVADPVREFQEAEAERALSRRIQPWWRRVWAWAQTGHKIWLGCIAIGTVFTGVNASMKKVMITSEPTIRATVHQAVQDELLDMSVRIKNLEDNTNGVPVWRGDITRKVNDHDKDLSGVIKQAERTDHRVDEYLMRHR